MLLCREITLRVGLGFEAVSTSGGRGGGGGSLQRQGRLSLLDSLCGHISELIQMRVFHRSRNAHETVLRHHLLCPLTLLLTPSLENWSRFAHRSTVACKSTREACLTGEATVMLSREVGVMGTLAGAVSQTSARDTMPSPAAALSTSARLSSPPAR